MTDCAVFDREAMLERVGGDAALLEEVLDLYREDGPGMVDAVRDAVAGDDPSMLERAAHSLKGALLNLSAEAAAREASGLERAARAGDRDVARRLENLEVEIRKLDAAIAAET